MESDTSWLQMESDTTWYQLGPSGTSWSFQLGYMEFGTIPVMLAIETFANLFELESDTSNWFQLE